MSTRTIMRRTLAAALAPALAAVICTSAPASATPDTHTPFGTEALNPSADYTADTASPDQAKAVSDAITSGRVDTKASKDLIDIDNTLVTPIPGEGTLSYTPLAIAGAEYSNITILFDSEGEVTHYTESHLRELSENSGGVKSWANGNLVQDRVVTAPEDAFADISPQDLGSAWAELNRCLSSAGIPAWIVAAAGVVCSLGSVPGIVACLTTLGVGAGTAGWCGASAIDAW